MSITVKAKEAGFYGKRRREGDVFQISEEKHLSKRWMERVDAKAEPTGDDKKPAPKAKAEPTGNKQVI